MAALLERQLDPVEVQERLQAIVDAWDNAPRRETLQEFLDRKSDPKFKVKPLPKPGKPRPRMSDAKFGELLRKQGASGSLNAAALPVEVRVPRVESRQEFLDRKSDPNWKPKPLPRPRGQRRLSEAKFAALLREHGGSGVVRVK